MSLAGVLDAAGCGHRCDVAGVRAVSAEGEADQHLRYRRRVGMLSPLKGFNINFHTEYPELPLRAEEVVHRVPCIGSG